MSIPSTAWIGPKSFRSAIASTAGAGKPAREKLE